jgi:hypothetical protein
MIDFLKKASSLMLMGFSASDSVAAEKAALCKHQDARHPDVAKRSACLKVKGAGTSEGADESIREGAAGLTGLKGALETVRYDALQNAIDRG